MTFFDFLNNHEFIGWCFTIWTIPIAAFACVWIVRILEELIEKIITNINVWRHGWPPAYMNDDGDLVCEYEEEIEEDED